MGRGGNNLLNIKFIVLIIVIVLVSKCFLEMWLNLFKCVNLGVWMCIW